MKKQDLLTVFAHVREITHVFGEKMDVLFECHTNTCGQAQVSHLTLIFYTLHKQMNVWRLRMLEPFSLVRLQDATAGLLHRHISRVFHFYTANSQSDWKEIMERPQESSENILLKKKKSSAGDLSQQS